MRSLFEDDRIHRDSDERSVNAMLFQPFVNYNIADGGYPVSSPDTSRRLERAREREHLDRAGEPPAPAGCSGSASCNSV